MDRDAVLDCYKRAVAKRDDIKVKGAKTSYTAINGNMFSFIDDQARICLRFSEKRKAELNKFYGSTDVLQYGAVMRGYVSFSDEVIVDETICNGQYRAITGFSPFIGLNADQSVDRGNPNVN